MGENSSLIIGEYDQLGLRYNGIDYHKLFTQTGFKATENSIIFEK
jgi:hypothetical protein